MTIPFKRAFWLAAFLCTTNQCYPQALVDMHAGLFVPVLTSNKFKFSNSSGLEFGGYSQKKINRHLGIFAEYYIFYGSLSVTGSNYTPVDTTRIPGNATTQLEEIGFNYTLGLDYFIIPRKLSLMAGLGISFNDILTPADLSFANIPPVSSFIVSNLGGFKFNYGFCLGVCCKIHTVQIALVYFNGLKNITSGTDMNTTMSDLTLQFHFLLREITIAKPCQNILVK